MSVPVLSWLFFIERTNWDTTHNTEQPPCEGHPTSCTASQIFLPTSGGTETQTHRTSRRIELPPHIHPSANPRTNTLLSKQIPLFSPQSQSFSLSYGSILPTSLTYLSLSARGYTPWRPDAVMSTIMGANKSLPRIFMGGRVRSRHFKREVLYLPP